MSRTSPTARPPRFPSAWKNSSTSSGVGRGAHVDRDDLIESELVAKLREHLLVGLRDGGRELVGDFLPRALEPHLLDARPRSPSAPARPLRRECRRASLEARLQLLEDPRHGEEPRRANLGQELDDLPRIGADRHLDAAGDRQVVMRAPLGDVGGRKPRDHLRASLRQLDHVLDARHQREQVAVRELDALRRPVVPEV